MSRQDSVINDHLAIVEEVEAVALIESDSADVFGADLKADALDLAAEFAFDKFKIAAADATASVLRLEVKLLKPKGRAADLRDDDVGICLAADTIDKPKPAVLPSASTI